MTTKTKKPTKWQLARAQENAELEALRAQVIANTPVIPLYAVVFGYHDQYTTQNAVLGVYTDKVLAEKVAILTGYCTVKEVTLNQAF